MSQVEKRKGTLNPSAVLSLTLCVTESRLRRVSSIHQCLHTRLCVRLIVALHFNALIHMYDHTFAWCQLCHIPFLINFTLR